MSEMNEMTVDERLRNLRLPRALHHALGGKAITTLRAAASKPLTVREVDVLLTESGVTEAQERMACKMQLEAGGFMEGTPIPRNPFL